jgi:pimeloyl-ACP methyl ester carboxylesterase
MAAIWHQGCSTVPVMRQQIVDRSDPHDHVTATSRDAQRASDAIRPFRIAVPQSDLDDLHNRLDRTRWPDELPGVGWYYGVPLDYLKQLAAYWRTSYDWRKQEARLNTFPQFTTVVDGATVHFLHVRSPEPDALPLIVTHGWPGSIVELLEVIGPLADPRAHGGDPSDAFHVVAPSLPGYGFSGPTPDTGWDVRRIARAFAALMDRLGYTHYGAHGTDWGSRISRDLGLLDRDHVVGIHIAMMLTSILPRDPAELKNVSSEDQRRLDRLDFVRNEQMGYGMMQSTRPQTLAYALTDSPVGQLAWIVDKFKDWTDCSNVPEEVVDRDQMLTNVSLYWLTGTAGSSSRLYYETMHVGSGWGTEEPSSTPTGVMVLPRDVTQPIRRFAERTNEIVQWTEFERGGHFPSMEVPAQVVADIRQCFRRLRGPLREQRSRATA